MTRFKVLGRDDMDEEQRQLVDDIMKQEGRVRGGPYTALIRTPKFMRLHQDMSFYHRKFSALTDRERQIAVLAVCRHWDAEYPWAVQVRGSLAAGVEQSIVDAVNAGKAPALSDPGEQAAWDVAVQLMRDHRVDAATYASAEKLFGLPKLVDLVTAVGFFSMVCCTANAFEITPPDDAPARLA